MKKTPYERLALIPEIVAEAVCRYPYTGAEWSLQNRPSQKEIAEVEDKRQVMTIEQEREFSDRCGARCRAAYERNAKWFMECVKAKGDRGRNQLYVWMSHWLVSYLNNSEKFLGKYWD